MDWLEDISEKLKQERRKAKQEAEMFERVHRDECHRAAPIVTRLLHDLGKMWYGGSWLTRNYRIHHEHPNRWLLTRKRPFEEEAMVVTLEILKESKPHFRVYCPHYGIIDTADTSEAELMRAIHTAAERLMEK
jgi:hypothetical protein